MICISYINQGQPFRELEVGHMSLFCISSLLDLPSTIFTLSSPLRWATYSEVVFRLEAVLHVTFIIILSSGGINVYYVCEADLFVSYIPRGRTLSLMLCERNLYLLCFERGIPTPMSLLLCVSHIPSRS